MIKIMKPVLPSSATGAGLSRRERLGPQPLPSSSPCLSPHPRSWVQLNKVALSLQVHVEASTGTRQKVFGLKWQFLESGVQTAGMFIVCSCGYSLPDICAPVYEHLTCFLSDQIVCRRTTPNTKGISSKIGLGGIVKWARQWQLYSQLVL